MLLYYDTMLNVTGETHKKTTKKPYTENIND